jgi:Lar family restriction alleviation protein
MMPCPFCGNTKTVQNSMIHYYILCTSCGATGPNAQTRDEASVKWNTRPMLVHYVKQLGRWVKHWKAR